MRLPMKRQLFNKLLVLLFLLPLQVLGQSVPPEEMDITGVWKGELYNDTTQKYLPYEIAISEEKGKLTGYTYTLFDIDGKQELGVKKVKIKRKDDKLIIEDVALIANTYSAPPPKGVRQMSVVNISSQDTTMQLSGQWSTTPTREYRPLTGSMQLKRARHFRPQVLFKKLEELKLDQTLSFVRNENKAEQELAQVAKAKTVGAMPADAPAYEPDAPNVAPAVTQPVTAGIAQNEIKIPEEEPAKLLQPIEKLKEVSPAVTGKKTSVAVAIQTPKTKPPVTVPAKPVEEKPAPVVAVNESPKKEVKVIPVASKPAIVDKPKATVPVVVAVKKDPPVVAARKPVAEVAKAPETKKPAPLTTPVTDKKPGPVAVVKPPVANPATPVIAPGKNVNIIAEPVPGAPPAAAEVAERKISNTQEVFFESDSLILSLYDNGTVDGDTVSVLMNGNIIFSRQGLTTRANNKTVYITADMPDSLVLVMYAENLGSIPPNTGLLVVRDGEATYDVRFRADLQSNSAIILRKRRKN